MGLKIEISTIAHSEQRYETAGDWFYEGDTLKIVVSQLGDWRREALVAVHELIEALWCRSEGIEERVVTAFDLEQAERGNFEPGDEFSAPYHYGHGLAEVVERLLALELFVDWFNYANQLDELHPSKNNQEEK